MDGKEFCVPLLVTPVEGASHQEISILVF